MLSDKWAYTKKDPKNFFGYKSIKEVTALFVWLQKMSGYVKKSNDGKTMLFVKRLNIITKLHWNTE